MDDILASIRKILNEDDPAPAAAPASADPPAEEAPLELTPDMMLAEPAPDTEPAVPEPTSPAPEPEAGDGLVAPAAAAAAAAAFGQLARALAQEREVAVSRGTGLTLEDVVREELRPLLKAWLDEHLPALVERLVRTEIERLMSRAR